MVNVGGASVKKSEFKNWAKSGIRLLDGATGSNLRKSGLPVGVCAEKWVLEHPEAPMKLMQAYVEAGSDIVYAPTFAANRVGLGLYGLEDHVTEFNEKIMALAKRAVGNRARIAGDMTTTGQLPEPDNDQRYHEWLKIYSEQATALSRAGADLLVLETMLTIEEASAAVEAIEAACDLPVMVSFTVSADGQLLFGGSIEDAVTTMEALGASAVGVNCSVGPEQLEATVRTMKQATSLPIIAKPNAGMPKMDALGQAHYDMTPEAFASAMQKLVHVGANLIGGCCGTDPDTIRMIHRFC